MTREEIIDFCDMKAQLEPENEDIFKAIIKALEQEPRKGHWIALENWLEVGKRVKCSACGQVFVTGDKVSRNFCSNCGAKMEEVEK